MTDASQSSEDRRVSDYMSDLVDWVSADARLPEVQERLEELDVSALAVLDEEGHPAGVVSRTDLIRAGRVHPRGSDRQRLLTLPDDPVRTVMAARVVAVHPNDGLAHAGRRMSDERTHRLFVIDEDAVVGVFSTFDAMQAVCDERVETPLKELMSTSLVVVEASAPVSLAVDRMTAAFIHAVVVVDQGWPIGIFGQADALAVRDVPPSTPVEEWMDVAVLSLPVGMHAHRAAAHALAMDVEHVLVMNDEGTCGIVTALDFARALK